MSNSSQHRERRRLAGRAKSRKNRKARNPIYGAFARYRMMRAITVDSCRAAIERLTNHQRSLWGRAGHPGLAARDPAPILQFAE